MSEEEMCIHGTLLDRGEPCESCAELVYGGLPETPEELRALVDRVQVGLAGDPERRVALRTAESVRDLENKKRHRAAQEAWMKGRMN